MKNQEVIEKAIDKLKNQADQFFATTELEDKGMCKFSVNVVLEKNEGQTQVLYYDNHNATVTLEIETW